MDIENCVWNLINQIPFTKIVKKETELSNEMRRYINDKKRLNSRIEVVCDEYSVVKQNLSYYENKMAKIKDQARKNEDNKKIFKNKYRRFREVRNDFYREKERYHYMREKFFKLSYDKYRLGKKMNKIFVSRQKLYTSYYLFWVKLIEKMNVLKNENVCDDRPPSSRTRSKTLFNK